jgi:hypothetical protein
MPPPLIEFCQLFIGKPDQKLIGDSLGLWHIRISLIDDRIYRIYVILDSKQVGTRVR